MCGRYVLEATPEQLQMAFDLDNVPQFAPRYNIAPTQLVPVITNEAPRVLTPLRWGLLPSWAKDESMGSKMINARAETVTEKPAFRAAFKRRRCIVPASGYYEWQQREDGKQPIYIHLPDVPVFGLAGLWEVWHNPNGDEIRTYTIITTQANAFTTPLHHRMPVILPPDAYDEWLHTDEQGAGALIPLLQPRDIDGMKAFEVSRAVNRPVVDDPSLIAPIN